MRKSPFQVLISGSKQRKKENLLWPSSSSDDKGLSSMGLFLVGRVPVEFSASEAVLEGPASAPFRYLVSCSIPFLNEPAKMKRLGGMQLKLQFITYCIGRKTQLTNCPTVFVGMCQILTHHDVHISCIILCLFSWTGHQVVSVSLRYQSAGTTPAPRPSPTNTTVTNWSLCL